MRRRRNDSDRIRVLGLSRDCERRDCPAGAQRREFAEDIGFYIVAAEWLFAVAETTIRSKFDIACESEP
jgi:hypothetical protein